MTESPPLSDSLLAFIRQHIHSVEQLEILLMLRAHAETKWTATRVSEEMRTGLSSATERLSDLESRGLLVSVPNGAEPTYRFAPRTPLLDENVAALQEAYAERKYTIINLIFSKPIDKIRVFARAFRFRRDDDSSEE